MRTHVIAALARREIVSWFSNPAGYVFLTLFVFLCAMAAFWQDRFFAENMATLAPLDDLFPYLLLFFIPAVTMGTWAEERRQGTEELLLTLPARDVEIVLGKYLGALGIYLAALLFSTTNLLVLTFLGDPDRGLVLGSFLGYAFLGGTLVAVGLVGSLLASSATVGFILGAVLCAATVFADRLGLIIGGRAEELAETFGVRILFREFTDGMIPLPGVVVFVGIALAALQANIGLLRYRRHGRGPLSAHDLVRTVSLVVAAVAAGVIAGRLPLRPDLTEERLHSLSPETRALLESLDPARPVFVQAFVSPKVPGEHAQTRDDLLSLLRRFDHLGGDRILLRIQETELFTPEAQEAEERFGIRPRPVMSVSDGRGTSDEIFLGFVATCGAQEVVVPFLHPGIPVEYELARSVRTASSPKRLRVGVLRTDADLMGGFDFQRMSQNPEWGIVSELKKQYEVVAVDPDMDYPDNLNVLIAAMASSLTQPHLDRLRDWAFKGGAVLFFDDALPTIDPSLGPMEPKKKPGGNNPFGGGPPPEKKGDFRAFLTEMGIDWPVDDVVWDAWKPHPALELPEEVVFVGPGSGNAEGFSTTDPIASGLQEAVAIFSGHIKPAAAAGVTFTPLLRTGHTSGIVRAGDVLQRSFFGVGGLNPRRARTLTADDYILAARVKGERPAADDGPARKVNAVFVADLDLVSSMFFDLRAQGREEFNFDNVTFVLNAVDVLAGDESVVALRKRRRVHRTLTAVEEQTRVHEERRMQETRAAEEEATRRLEEAQAALDAKVEALRKREDLDENTREIMVAAAQQSENRRLAAATATIEAERGRAVRASGAEKETAVRAIQQRIRWLAVILPPLPALLLGFLVFERRMKRERRATPERRRVEDVA